MAVSSPSTIEGKRDAQYPMLHKTSYTPSTGKVDKVREVRGLNLFRMLTLPLVLSLRIYRIPYAGTYGLAG